MSLSGLKLLPPPNYGELVPDFRVVLSSLDRGWRGIHVLRYEIAPQLEPVRPPTIDGHVLGVAHGKNGPIVEGFVDRKVLRAQASPGQLVLTPYGMPVTARWAGRLQTSQVMLANELVNAVAADLSSRQPEGVELVFKAYFHDPLILQLYQALEAEITTAGLFGTLYADSLAQTLALHFLRNYSTLSVNKTLPGQRLAPKDLHLVQDYIHDYLERNLSLKELASLVGLSPAYFAQQFKKATGLPPHQYLISQRVKRASELLVRGELSVAQVAQTVGFADQSHLYRHFKRAYGVGPSDVLKERKNVQILP